MVTKKPAAKKLVGRKAVPAKKAATPTTTPTRRKTGPVPAKKMALDALGIDAVCNKILDGETLTNIAISAKVSIGTLLTWLASNPEYSARAREARIQAAKGWDEEALALIKGAVDVFALAKAREAAQHLRWRASKIAPRDYGDKLAFGQADDLLPLVTIKDMTGRKG